ncbi:hypothetical protein C5B90_04560 [Haloferax sp. Atlit-12N]|uniref:hypothetical protein n=1 Tax=Haloferax sp. Atlit-12N TaxID=2077203 RepID=UPI000E280587|nr:hypothetical protein [Haloferax sp. Atlit-12N]RDZ65635.1 hypothetical protein C5B90_04560 [Haloferax sp. Atlit-12N]
MKRRDYLATIGLGVAGLFAGCIGSQENSPTTTTTAGEYYGPTSENSTNVDLRLRDFTDDGIADVRNNASSPAYNHLLENIDSYTREAVHYMGTVGQVTKLDREDNYYFLVATGDSWHNLLYASWVGDTVHRGDEITLWGRVLGTETYQPVQGSQRTVPALAVADIDVERSNS